MGANEKDPLAEIAAFFRRKHVPESDVLDLCQDAYARMLAYVASHEGAHPSIKLLQQIAGSVLKDYFKARTKRPMAQEDPSDVAEEASESDLEREYNDREIIEAVREIVATKDDRIQRIFDTLLTDDLLVAAVARRHGIPERTAEHLRNKTIVEIRDELKRRNITRALPVDLLQENGAPSSDRHGVALGPRPIEATSFSKHARSALRFLFAAALGALILFLLLPRSPTLARLHPGRYIVLATGGEATQGSAPRMPVQTDVAPVQCPSLESGSSVSPSTPGLTQNPSRHPKPAEEKSDATNRFLFQTIRRAEDRGDCETVRQLAPKLTGQFAAMFAKHGRCQLTP